MVVGDHSLQASADDAGRAMVNFVSYFATFRCFTHIYLRER